MFNVLLPKKKKKEGKMTHLKRPTGPAWTSFYWRDKKKREKGGFKRDRLVYFPRRCLVGGKEEGRGKKRRGGIREKEGMTAKRVSLHFSHYSPFFVPRIRPAAIGRKRKKERGGRGAQKKKGDQVAGGSLLPHHSCSSSAPLPYQPTSEKKGGDVRWRGRLTVLVPLSIRKEGKRKGACS